MNRNINILVGILIASATMFPILLHSEVAAPSPDLFERARRTISFPQLTVSMEENGQTSINGVHFFLCNGRFPGTVEGVAIALTQTMREPLALTVENSDGDLLLSCSLSAEQEGKYSIYFFSLSQTYISGAKLLFYTRDRTAQLPLSSVVRWPNTVLALGDLVGRVSSTHETYKKGDRR